MSVELNTLSSPNTAFVVVVVVRGAIGLTLVSILPPDLWSSPPPHSLTKHSRCFFFFPKRACQDNNGAEKQLPHGSQHVLHLSWHSALIMCCACMTCIDERTRVEPAVPIARPSPSQHRRRRRESRASPQSSEPGVI